MKSTSTGTWRRSIEELRQSLLKDGGRTVVNGGDPYEDDLEAECAEMDAEEAKE